MNTKKTIAGKEWARLRLGPGWLQAGYQLEDFQQAKEADLPTGHSFCQVLVYF